MGTDSSADSERLANLVSKKKRTKEEVEEKKYRTKTKGDRSQNRVVSRSANAVPMGCKLFLIESIIYFINHPFPYLLDLAREK